MQRNQWLQKLVVVALASAGVGCGGSECELGHSRCVSATHIERCEEGYDPYTPPHWNESECFSDYFEHSLCVVAPTGAAYCAAESEPRPDLCPVPAQATGEVVWTNRAEVKVAAKSELVDDSSALFETALSRAATTLINDFWTKVNR